MIDSDVILRIDVSIVLCLIVTLCDLEVRSMIDSDLIGMLDPKFTEIYE